MPKWKKLATAFVLLAVATVPTAVWAGTHLLQQHGHGREAEHVRHEHGLTELAEILVHGHEHWEGVPDHQHNFLPSPPLRPAPPLDLQAPGHASLEAPDAGTLLLSSARPRLGRIVLSGSSPPRLHFLCILLI